MSFKEEVERNLSELGEIIDAAERKYKQSMETEDDYAALELLEAAIDLMPDYREAWHAMGERYMGLHLVDKAEKCLVQAWRYGGSVDTYLCLAEINLQKEMHSSADMFYGFVLNVEPDNLRALLGQAAFLRVEEKFLEAYRVYGDVLELLRLKEVGADIGQWLKKRKSRSEARCTRDICVHDYCDYRDIE